ncbi:hypothetical protein H6G33_15615 [Calothrix sp. FACHB-1219]|uniref:hypothetical protein n=1 Tax=unclassified Calothrix TaxID=2619626 RepID=UPI001682DE27|nr:MULTISPECIES: hypothetical protein [unclassified Calothrix]MBD2205332.1 hypothetical protein [Calothrix sp. FACHB-168]MBD2218463.1 hypothetical protein [Calothrix sp. FACHB-1219]
MRNETQHLGSSVGFRRASTQPTIFLNRAVLRQLCVEENYILETPAQCSDRPIPFAEE